MNLKLSSISFTLTAALCVRSSRTSYSERAQAQGLGEGAGHCALGKSLVGRTLSRALYSF